VRAAAPEEMVSDGHNYRAIVEVALVEEAVVVAHLTRALQSRSGESADGLSRPSRIPENIGLQCRELMDRVWYRQRTAVSLRRRWTPLRYAAEFIPVVVAGAGGSIIVHVHGT
jgi:hypothetical protein